jgi:hypothetical protein
MKKLQKLQIAFKVVPNNSRLNSIKCHLKPLITFSDRLSYSSLIESSALFSLRLN